MNLLILVISAFLVMPSISKASAPCPPNSCNPFNGCTDGCTTQQKQCSLESDLQCVGKSLGNVCRWRVGSQSGQGFCNAVAVSGQSAACACQ